LTYITPLLQDEYLDGVLEADDLANVKRASSMPLFVIESLLTMVRSYSSPEVSANASKAMNQSLHGLMAPFSEAERIKSNPVGAYGKHCSFATSHLFSLLSSTVNR
jgi:hypothetical protein